MYLRQKLLIDMLALHFPGGVFQSLNLFSDDGWILKIRVWKLQWVRVG
jgi:hypothetical protein